MSDSGLSKAVWTDADFATMGWHDCRVHAVSVVEYEDDTVPATRLLLDLDYIVRWVDPAPRQKHFTFWVAPSTLVFEQAWDITGEIGPLYDCLEISDLNRLDPPDDRPYPRWHLAGHTFDLKFRARGFRQYVRTAPQHVDRQVLTMTERGGLSFAEQAFA
ncbi:hypothetical protein Q5425_41310 [Amycolatopsis sp. A133]|uniref:hypothetical protein n=1 Tax=Amycolatopsis sp. A133 TaxID=3064472 RepID=UPI0027EF9AE9|nr:hypothetical protein [Amycolatopsis sp. A133]MDQ7810202.1 hypothetical protein [Amycolatopsis sp. A133]